MGLIRWIYVWVGRLVRMILTGVLLSLVCGCALIAWVGSRPVGPLGGDPPAVVLDDISYWEFMADRLAANALTPSNCRNTRLYF